jgi:hypothetical protein
MFLDDMGPDGADARAPDLEELPSGVILRMTKCYSPGCSDEDPCYAFVCPRKVREARCVRGCAAHGPCRRRRRRRSRTHRRCRCLTSGTR